MRASKDQPGVILFGKRERFQYFDVHWPVKENQPRFIERFIKPFYVSVIRLREGQELIGYYRMLVNTPEGAEEKYHIFNHFQYAEDEQGTEERGRPSFLAFAIVIPDESFPSTKYISELYAGLKSELSDFYRKPTLKLAYDIQLRDDFDLRCVNPDRKINRGSRTNNFFNAGAQLDKQISFLYSQSSIESIIGQFYELAVRGEGLFESNHVYLSSTPLNLLRHQPIDEQRIGDFESVSKRKQTPRSPFQDSKREEAFEPELEREESENEKLKALEALDEEKILGGGFGHVYSSKKDDQNGAYPDLRDKISGSLAKTKSKGRGKDLKADKSKPGPSQEEGEEPEKESREGSLPGVANQETKIRKDLEDEPRGLDWTKFNSFFKDFGQGLKKFFKKWGLRLLAIAGLVVMIDVVAEDAYGVSLFNLIGTNLVEEPKAPSIDPNKDSNRDLNSDSNLAPTSFKSDFNKSGSLKKLIDDYNGEIELIVVYDSAVVNMIKDASEKAVCRYIQISDSLLQSSFRTIYYKFNENAGRRSETWHKEIEVFLKLVDSKYGQTNYDDASTKSKPLKDRFPANDSRVIKQRKKEQLFWNIARDLRQNIFKARSYIAYDSDTFELKKQEYFQQYLNTARLSVNQKEFIEYCIYEFEKIHKEWRSGVYTTEQRKLIKWLEESNKKDKKLRQEVLKKIEEDLNKKSYASDFINLLKIDIYFLIKDENRKDFIHNELSDYPKLNKYYLGPWQDALKSRSLSEAFESKLFILRKDGSVKSPVNHYTILKNGLLENVYPGLLNMEFKVLKDFQKDFEFRSDVGRDKIR